jgi:hypothetical protein
VRTWNRTCGIRARPAGTATHDRKESPHKYGDSAISLKEVFDVLEFPPAHQDVAPPPLDQTPAAAGAYEVSNGRSYVAAEHAARRDPDQAEAPSRDEVTGERHYDLGGKRDAGRFRRHEEGDPKITGRGNDRDDPGGNIAYDLINHHEAFPLLVKKPRPIQGAGWHTARCAPTMPR